MKGVILNMLSLTRICIPLGLSCNFKCKYCFRMLSTDIKIPKITDEFIKYLNGLNKETTEAVVVTGGEPLLYISDMKKVFDSVKPEIHKKIISNGSLLTEDLAKYINDNDIEFDLSYDGPNTEYLRGVNVLDDEKILSLVKNIRVLNINAVITNKNCNIYEIYEDLVKRLKRYDFRLSLDPCYYNGYNKDLLNDFDYNLFRKSLYKFYKESKLDASNVSIHYNAFRNKFIPINLLLDGTAIDMTSLSVIGNIHSSFKELKDNLNKLQNMNYCNSKQCELKDMCIRQSQTCSDHIYKIEKCIFEVKDLINSEEGNMKCVIN